MHVVGQDEASVILKAACAFTGLGPRGESAGSDLRSTSGDRSWVPNENFP